jgi:transcriptional regulator with XRE-family HTH domain
MEMTWRMICLTLGLVLLLQSGELMDPSPEVRIGERLRFYRQGRGKTQAVVAGLAGVTEDYLSQIERGLKTPTISLLHRFSKVLGVRISELHALQRALLAHDGKLGPAASVDLAELRDRVDAAWDIWQGRPRRFTEESAILPALITDVQAAQRALESSETDEDRRQAHQLAADLYFLLRTYAKRIGRNDLALLVADRGVVAAQAANDPFRTAAAQWNLGHVLLAQGDADGAEDVAIHAIEDLRRQQGLGGLEVAALEGALWLVSAVAAVRNGDPWTARDRVREKAWAAAREAGEGNVFWTVFGPVNVALHAMSLEMETGEASEALRLADDIDACVLPSLERRTTFALEVARCYEQRRDDPGVLVHLANAESTGPEDMRYNSMARELMQGLLKRARPTYAPQVRALADRIGLLS